MGEKSAAPPMPLRRHAEETNVATGIMNQYLSQKSASMPSMSNAAKRHRPTRDDPAQSRELDKTETLVGLTIMTMRSAKA